MAVGAAYFGGQALNALGTGNNVSQSESSNAGLGIGLSSGKSWSEGGGSSYNFGTSQSTSDNYSDQYAENFADEWARTYGSEASAKDIERAKEANDKQYEFWKAQAEYNASEAEKQRAWQEKLANTAYQRTVADLLKAGLNPYLAATSLGGAATPSGAVASSGLSTAMKANTYADSESQSHSQGYSKGHSEGHSQSSSYDEGGGSNYSLGGSNNYGINFEINSGKSSSTSEPALGKIITNAVKTATASTSGKSNSTSSSGKSGKTIGQWAAEVKANSFKGFDGSGYDPAY